MEAQAPGKVGPCARGGKSRAPVAAVAHDVPPVATLPPVGIFLPACAALFVYGVTSTGTSDGLADRLAQWGEAVCARCPPIPPRALKVENGPENQRRRTQCMPS